MLVYGIVTYILVTTSLFCCVLLSHYALLLCIVQVSITIKYTSFPMMDYEQHGCKRPTQSFECYLLACVLVHEQGALKLKC